jgi:CHAT domain-containing protein
LADALPRSRLFLGPQANEEALRRHGPGSRFVHVATHGLFRYDNPMFSSLQLGGSRLSLFDLYQLELTAELVTLSGCGTGLNVVEGGDELMGLVRGLLYAGAQSALLTLWDVNDRTTAEFMTGFYRRLPTAPSKAEALQGTMREIREKYPHPFYWAPFVLVGRAH